MLLFKIVEHIGLFGNLRGKILENHTLFAL